MDCPSRGEDVAGEKLYQFANDWLGTDGCGREVLERPIDLPFRQGISNYPRLFRLNGIPQVARAPFVVVRPTIQNTEGVS